MSGEQLSADDAWHTVRRYGLGHLLATAFVRFRYGDGFSHARAFGMQLALAAVPLVIAGAGLAAALGVESFAEVVARTVVAISPGSSDALVADVVEGGVRRGQRARRGRRRARAGHRVPRRDLGVRPAGAGRQPDLRHQARPARPAQVRARRAADRDRRARRWRSGCC